MLHSLCSPSVSMCPSSTAVSACPCTPRSTCRRPAPSTIVICTLQQAAGHGQEVRCGSMFLHF